jgi:GTP-binding protein
MGPPSGGNGGRGGDIYVVASKEVTSLGGIMNAYKAPNGTTGETRNMHGANAKEIEIVVPVGTVIRQVDPLSGKAQNLTHDNDDLIPDKSEEELAEERLDHIKKYYRFRTGYTPHEDRIELLKGRIPPPTPLPHKRVDLDLAFDGERSLLLRGGRGGLGNPHFASNDIKGPGIAGRGEPGRTIWLELELKTLADAGLVGLPNAGKSTLLGAISNAHPKIASHPFTTLNPYVGTIDYPDFWSMTVADIPGLVEGAHLNIGLGHSFLRHVERSRVLVYVIDLAGRNPSRDLAILRQELEAYKPGLTRRPSVVIANKADLGDVARQNLDGLRKEAGEGVPVVPVSAKDRKNITTATSILRKVVVESAAEGNN